MRGIEAEGNYKEWKMESVNFKSWKQEPIDLNIAYIPPPDTYVPPEEMEAARAFTSTNLTGRIDLRNRSERAILTPRNEVGRTKSAEMAEYPSRRGLLQSQISNHTILSRSLHHPELPLKFKRPHRESCSAPGTSVYYTPRQTITSKDYVNASTIEALFLLADVSCEVARTHLQQSCNQIPKLSEIDIFKERFNQTPLQKKMTSLPKNSNRPKFKEHCTEQYSKRITDSYKIVRRLRTPRRTSSPALRCPTKLQKNISLSKCDEIFSCLGESSASLADTAHNRDRLAMTDTSAITSASKDMLSQGKFPDDKSISNIDSVPRVDLSATTLERVSKSSCQISGTKKKPFRGLKRAERFSNKILQFIGGMAVPEKLIRETLGNNPDTSKALRLLLAEHKVKRFGPGGRGQAYEYVATEKGLLHIQRVNQATSEAVELTPENVPSCNPSSGPTIVSNTPKSEAPTQDTNSTKVAESGTSHESWTYSVTPHCSSQWPLKQTLSCVLSTESLDLLSSGSTHC